MKENPTLQNIISIWEGLSVARRIYVGLATLLVILSVLAIAKDSTKRNLSLLFGSLEPDAAGDVIVALDQRGVKYEVRGNAIYVPGSDRDLLRVMLAGEGLPAIGSQGYEILDGLSGFGTTSQMFDAAYWRAKEGELSRTIITSPGVRAARVHISPSNERSFKKNNKATAAVSLTTNGNTLSARQVSALQYLVASAVSGLDPADVAILDDKGGLISDGDSPISRENGDKRAEALRTRAERLLEARVGINNAIVEVTIETVTEAETILERRIEPEGRVAISTDISEIANSSKNDVAGSVSVASNLPTGDAENGSGTSNSEISETRALTNYEVSETEREIVRVPGDVRRLTVAVLINELASDSSNNGENDLRRSDQELESLEALVASAVGLNTDRGDRITLRSMPFEPVSILGTEVAASRSLPINFSQLLPLLVFAVVSLILGLFVVRPIFAPKNFPALEAISNPTQAKLAVETQQFSHANESNSLQITNAASTADPVTRLREMITDRETEAVQILQDWMEEPRSERPTT